MSPGTRSCRSRPAKPAPSLMRARTTIHRRSQVVTNGSGKPHSDQTAKEGVVLVLKTNIPPSLSPPGWFSPSATEIITHLDPDNHRVAWANTAPKWILAAQRWQSLTAVEGGKTKYETIEVFNGPLAWLMRWFMGRSLEGCFERMGQDLKNWVEQSIMRSVKAEHSSCVV